MTRPPPYTVHLDADVAQQLAEQGGALLVLGLPEGSYFGIDHMVSSVAKLAGAEENRMPQNSLRAGPRDFGKHYRICIYFANESVFASRQHAHESSPTIHAAQAFHVGPRFQGVKMLPPGVHFAAYSVPGSARHGGGMGPLTGFFFSVDKGTGIAGGGGRGGGSSSHTHGTVVVRRYDRQQELLVEMPEEEVGGRVVWREVGVGGWVGEGGTRPEEG